jgi:phage tail sheath gpL-like
VNGGTVGANQFQIGATDAVSATNLAAALNAITNLAAEVYIAVDGTTAAQVNLRAVEEGVEGNLIPISGSGGISASDTTLTGGSAGRVSRLAGGADATPIVYHCGL